MRVVVPFTPETVTPVVPAAALVEAVRVSVEVAEPPEAGFTELGEKLAVAPEGSPLAERATAALKPFRLVTVTVEVTLAPGFTDTDEGEVESEKSDVTVPPQLGNLKEPMRVD